MAALGAAYQLTGSYVEDRQEARTPLRAERCPLAAITYQPQVR